jgi:hypothetical protein
MLLQHHYPAPRTGEEQAGHDAGGTAAGNHKVEI